MANQVLLAEDDRATREALSRALELEGYRVRAVADGSGVLGARNASDVGTGTTQGAGGAANGPPPDNDTTTALPSRAAGAGGWRRHWSRSLLAGSTSAVRRPTPA